MSCLLRVRIEFTSKNQKNSFFFKFVYLVHSSIATTVIKKLTSILQQYIADQFGSRDAHLVSLLTEDGFLLTKDDRCSNVLKHNEKLICVSMYQFSVENVSTFNTNEAWLKLENDNNIDDIKKYLGIGMNNVGIFYVYLFGGMASKSYTISVQSNCLIWLMKKSVHILLYLDVDTSMIKISATSPFEWFIEVIWE